MNKDFYDAGGDRNKFKGSSSMAELMSPIMSQCLLILRASSYDSSQRRSMTPNPKSAPLTFPRSLSMDNLVIPGAQDLFSQPHPPEPSPGLTIKSPMPIPHSNSFLDSIPNITIIPSSSTSPVNVRFVFKDDTPSPIFRLATSQSDKTALKGKAPVISVTPTNSSVSSPTNYIGSDLDLLLRRESLQLQPLTIHKPKKSSSIVISATSAKNIMVRRKQNRGSRHFRGRKGISKIDVQESSLVNIPIFDLAGSGPLRASMPKEGTT